MTRSGRSRLRFWTQTGFFALFVLAPPLDLFRLDLTRGHAILFGQDWTLGIDAFLSGRADAGEAALSLLLRGFLPIFGGAAVFLWLAWRYGRLYCGWLCPHFSVVETINALMLKARGSPSLWERPTPPTGAVSNRAVSAGVRRNPWYWFPTLAAILGFAFLWALVLLSYLLPPASVYGGLIHGSLTRNQWVFLSAATLAFSVDFLLARHLFCRFGCAVGLFQSLTWMANDRAMVVGLDTPRAGLCSGCPSACDRACPMRLKPRTVKRRMFACTQCSACIDACNRVRGDGMAPLRWVSGPDALSAVTGRPAPVRDVPPNVPHTARPARQEGF